MLLRKFHSFVPIRTDCYPIERSANTLRIF